MINVPALNEPNGHVSGFNILLPLPHSLKSFSVHAMIVPLRTYQADERKRWDAYD
jgi:hypothetical protein